MRGPRPRRLAAPGALAPGGRLAPARELALLRGRRRREPVRPGGLLRALPAALEAAAGPGRRVLRGRHRGLPARGAHQGRRRAQGAGRGVPRGQALRGPAPGGEDPRRASREPGGARREGRSQEPELHLPPAAQGGGRAEVRGRAARAACGQSRATGRDLLPRRFPDGSAAAPPRARGQLADLRPEAVVLRASRARGDRRQGHVRPPR
mmetsp:Transcript_15866/g.46290  ORF Transcript_15866/g.46290 Transcript_15866/m.46290 type:complete len:208 (-) Transcript_15866:144-767(-)